MEIVRRHAGEWVEFLVSGRIDAYWADHLSGEIDDAVRGGAHRIALNCEQVSYLSSAGIRVLIRALLQLQSMNGSFSVVSPSPSVRRILETVGVWNLVQAGPPSMDAAVSESAPAADTDTGSARMESFALEPGAKLRCLAVGPEDPFGLPQSPETFPFPASAFGFGVGSIGGDLPDDRDRSGEFLAVSGFAVVLPTDGTNTPDFLAASGLFVPEVRVCSGLRLDGAFSLQIRFDASERAGSISLADLAKTCLDAVHADRIGMVLLAETQGLVGTALKKPPSDAAAESPPFDHPRIRDWFTFTSERAYANRLALAAGVVARDNGGLLGGRLRPLAGDSRETGHFHAAVFPFRPLKKGALDLGQTVASLFESENVESVLHLLNDDRQAVGAGQCEFIRGACWIGPLAD